MLNIIETELGVDPELPAEKRAVEALRRVKGLQGRVNTLVRAGGRYQKRIAELEAALRPFAKLYQWYPRPSDVGIDAPAPLIEGSLTYQDLVNAREALEK